MLRLYFDGAIKFNPDRKTGKIGWGFVIKNKEEIIFTGGGFCEEGTTPQAEYLGLISGLKKILELQKEFIVFGDSQLIVYQVSNKWKCYKDSLKPFCLEAQKLLGKNKIDWIPRIENQEADKISKEKLNEGLQNAIPSI
jgi:ribonuclease HI